jgi:hypothetical protein
MNRKQKFFKRLRDELELNIPDDAYMENTHAGRHQRSAGAWTSVIRSEKDRLFEIGLFSPIADLVRCPKLLIGDSYGMYVDCGCIGKCKGIAPQKNIVAGQNGLQQRKGRNLRNRGCDNCADFHTNCFGVVNGSKCTNWRKL